MCMSLLKLAQLQKIEVKLKKHKLIWKIAQDFANSGIIRGASGGITVLNAGLAAHQHT